MPQIPNGGDWTPSQYPSNGNSGAQSPAALHAKEEEIKKMREMIAEREQSRLRKLAMLSRATPTSVPPARVSSNLKQEDDDLSTVVVPSHADGLKREHFTNGLSRPVTKNTALQDGVHEGPHRKDSGSIIPILDPAAAIGSASGNSSASATPPIGSLSQSLAPSTAD
jgi:hypothetical protein